MTARACRDILISICRTCRIASLETCERSTSIPNLFISRTTFGLSIKLPFLRHHHLLPKLAEPPDPWGEVAHLNLGSISPGGVAPMGEGHVPCTHPVQGAHQWQATSYSVARLNTNLSWVKLVSLCLRDENKPNWQFSLRLLPPRCQPRWLPSANRQGSETQIAG